MEFVRWVLGMCDPERKPPELREAEGAFTAAELSALHKQHAALALEHHSQDLDDAVLLSWAGLQHATPALATGVCEAVRRQQPNDAAPVGSGTATSGNMPVSLAAITIAKAKLEKMDAEAALSVIWSVLDPAATGVVTMDHLAELLRGVLGLALAGADMPPMDTTKHAHALAAGAVALTGAEPLDASAVTKWLKRMTPIKQAFGALLTNVGRVDAAGGNAAHALPEMHGVAPSPLSSQLPQRRLGQVPAKRCLLSPPWVWLLSQAMSSELREEWQLLFNSDTHGMSFATFLGRLPEDAAPTLLLIRDKHGFLFGGVACEPWTKHGGFYGEGPYMALSLEPAAMLYPASGINSNHQWCGVGFSELPNGIGFGGQKGHFGCWLDASFDHGMSRPNATFAAPCLASEQQFVVDVVECWLLKRPPDDSARGANSKGPSALHQAKEDQAILQLAGVHKAYSQNVIEPIEED